MMDGMIQALRAGLDGAGYSHIPIMSYSTKFSSSYYGPLEMLPNLLQALEIEEAIR